MRANGKLDENDLISDFLSQPVAIRNNSFIDARHKFCASDVDRLGHNLAQATLMLMNSPTRGIHNNNNEMGRPLFHESYESALLKVQRQCARFPPTRPTADAPTSTNKSKTSSASTITNDQNNENSCSPEKPSILAASENKGDVELLLTTTDEFRPQSPARPDDNSCIQRRIAQARLQETISTHRILILSGRLLQVCLLIAVLYSLRTVRLLMAQTSGFAFRTVLFGMTVFFMTIDITYSFLTTNTVVRWLRVCSMFVLQKVSFAILDVTFFLLLRKLIPKKHADETVQRERRVFVLVEQRAPVARSVIVEMSEPLPWSVVASKQLKQPVRRHHDGTMSRRRRRPPPPSRLAPLTYSVADAKTIASSSSSTTRTKTTRLPQQQDRTARWKRLSRFLLPGMKKRRNKQ